MRPAPHLPDPRPLDEARQEWSLGPCSTDGSIEVPPEGSDAFVSMIPGKWTPSPYCPLRANKDTCLDLEVENHCTGMGAAPQFKTPSVPFPPEALAF